MDREGVSNSNAIYLNDRMGNFSILLINTNVPKTSLSNAEFAEFDFDGFKNRILPKITTEKQFFGKKDSV